MMKDRHLLRLRALFRVKKGATAIEYGLIMALVCLVALGGVSLLGNSVKGRWGDIANKVTKVTPN